MIEVVSDGTSRSEDAAYLREEPRRSLRVSLLRLVVDVGDTETRRVAIRPKSPSATRNERRAGIATYHSKLSSKLHAK